MKYVALLSGGKDSCFNLLHCQKNGHELVAAASLRPEQGKEELDSYLYQTVGQDAIEFVAHALDVPLYRETIIGTAVEQGSEYGTRSSRKGVDGDETEDLYNLLTNVKSHHPDVQGVSVGAILSNYQRVRVEHVCQRLSLTCLCYLWQRRQDELLSEMIEAGMEAILIKVAGIGLTTKHLGKSLAEMRPTLTKLNDLYGSHICGEGGEYESLTLDCPLFKSRIVLTDVETVIHSDNDFATVAYLRIKNARLEPKPTSDAHAQLTVPPILDEDFEAVRTSITEVEPHSFAVHLSESVPHSLDFTTATKSNGKWVAVTNVQIECSADASIEDEITQCFHLLQERLASHNLSLAHSAIINLFLSSMDDFARVNSVYASFFGTSPPSRACVALDLPSGIRARIDCLAFVENRNNVNYERQALHVQSQSYWAPANIGPYSQAILAGERLLISGQIGLLPSSIALPSPRSLATETALAIQHADRVVAALRNGWEGHIQMAIYWLSEVGYINAVRKAIDVYDRDKVSVKLLVAVKTLPKGALVEKQVMAHTGRAWIEEEDSDYDSDEKKELVLKTVQPIFEQGNIVAGKLTLHWETSQSHDAPDSIGCTMLCLQGEYADNDVALVGTQLRSIRFLQRCLNNMLSIRNFYNVTRNPSSIRSLVSIILNSWSRPNYVDSRRWTKRRKRVSLVPCTGMVTVG
ncbi:meiotically up-regulated 71 protein [Lentinula edodes]|uniref:Diphthine--ammonia ligase n=1 Tax=Lentinula edodes TaxID=5353 RepID=A0A1Q3DVE9_LENED|nr:meiotically up-regulated 71 protein [Lentinula edodes]